MLKFRNWIERQGGARSVAHLLNIEVPTVYAWLSGRASPKALLMQQIVRLSKGTVSFDDIIDETKKPQPPFTRTTRRVEL